MAKQTTDIQAQCKSLIDGFKNGVFATVYLLMGDEPYYPELVCKSIIDTCVDESAKDFNETICFGADVNAGQVVTAARRFPMMSDRQLVVVKEAQLMKDFEEIAVYAENPLESTVLVLLFHKSAVDRRKALYKNVQKVGVVLDSPAIREYEIANWIQKYYASLGLEIEPQGAALLGESSGTEVSVIAVETEKLLKNLPEGTVRITAEDIENNIGFSRQYSIFELTKELSVKNSAKALKIASHIGNSAKFQLPAAVSALFIHFDRILKYGALLSRGVPPSPNEKADALAGVNPYFYREYDTAVRNYPPAKAMQIISLLAEYDYLGKGGAGPSVDEGSLLLELTVKILNI